MGMGRVGVEVFSIQTSFKPILFKGGRGGGKGERRLLAPVLFCTPAYLMHKKITNFIML
jgi:hypothetical protein